VNLSGMQKTFVILTILLIFPFALAQESEPPDQELDGRANILHLERPVPLDNLDDAVVAVISGGSSGGAANQSATQSAFANLTPQQRAYLQRLQDIDDYEQVLEELEYEGGAWGVQIAEELSTLGTLLHQQGNYEEAIDIFDRAVHINRINHGLFSPQQVPLIERAVDGHLALGQWNEADELQQYAFYVQTRAYGYGDPRMIDVFQNLAKWNIESFYRGVDEDPTLRLRQTFLLFRAAADTVAAHFGPRDARYVELLRDVAGASDMMTRYALPGVQVSTPINPNIRMVSEFAGGSRRPRSTGGGERALRSIIDFYSSPRRPDTDETRIAKAQAIADLGDWYMIQSRRPAAMRAYRDAYEALQDSERADELAQQIFGEIVFLPKFSNFDDTKKEALGIHPDSGARLGYVDMSFDVSQYGRANNFEVLAQEPPGLTRVDSEIISTVRNNMVRPIIIDGRTINSTAQRYRFHFWYQ
jgi:tetratricopeptide (TPR) repeat protein